MTDEDRDLLAAEYVLGTLEPDSRRRFAEALAREPGLRDLVAAWEERLEPLNDDVAPVEPPAALWQAIEGALDDQAPAAAVTLRLGEGRWRRLARGVEKKLLFRDAEANTESFLLRIAPGTRLPAHHHSKVEECVMLEGDFSIGGLRLVAGDYHAALAGTEHPELFSEGGALVFIRGEVRGAAA